MRSSRSAYSRRSFMKHTIAVAATVPMLSQMAMAANRSVHVFNWDTYIGPNTLEEFTKATGVEVKYDLFADNSELFARLRNGNTRTPVFGTRLLTLLEQAWLINVRDYFASELEQLKELEQQGLVMVSNEGLEVTAMGWYFVRAIAMVFDRYLQADKNRARFSRII